MFVYKIDVMKALKEKGYNSYRILKENILPQRVTTSFRRGELVSFAVYNKVCGLLECDIGDILHYVPDPNGGSEQPDGGSD